MKPHIPQQGLPLLLTLLLALLTVGLGINPRPAQAQEPAPAIDSTPSSYFVVVGSDQYVNAPGLTGVEGATADCIAVAEHLRTQGFPEDQIMSACGPELVRTRFFILLQEFARRVRSGGTLFVVWIGHGGVDPQSGQKFLITTDGSFDLFVSEEAQYAASGYHHDGITASLLYAVTRQNIPTNAHVVFVTDVARGGEYQANGGKIVLEGPSAEDFRDMPGVLALSPTPGKSVPAGLTRHAMASCVATPSLGTIINARQFLDCYATVMTQNGGTIEMAGEWKDEPLVFFPKPTLPMAPPPKRTPPVAKITLIAGGGVLTLAGGVGALVTYGDAIEIVKDVNAGVYGTADDPQQAEAAKKYNEASDRFTGFLVAGGVGAATAIVGIALPTPKDTNLTVTANVGPSWIGFRGTF